MDGQKQAKRQSAKKEIFARFNLRAFIFNSFYYFYRGVRGDRFWLFFSATPILAYLLFKIGLPIAAAAAAAILSVRLAAAFRADGDVRRQREENERPPQQAPVPWFSVSLTRVLLFSVVTFDLYSLYLAYKNWQAARDGNREYHISPFFRGWLFGIVFVIPLFLRMRKSFVAARQKTTLFDVCAFLYITLTIAAFAVRHYMIVNINFSLFNLLIILRFLKILCLLPLQKTINGYNRILDPQSRPLKKFLPGEIALAAAAAALFIGYYGYSGRFAIRRFYRNFDRETRNEIINSYVFGQAYPEICAKYGYRMKNYGQTFERIYQKELASLARKLKDKNMTMEEAWSYGGRHLPEIMSRRLEKELIDVSEEMFGTKSSDTRKNMRHFCSFIDMSAELVIKKQLNK